MTYFLNNDNIATIEKIDTSKLDYSFDFSEWLAAVVDSIATYEITGDVGITIDSTLQFNGIVTAFVSGGLIGSYPKVTCKITTADGRIDSRTIKLQIVAQR